ncbi:hypothetical protein [Aquitalea denitrificans]|uniref:hypothetical protein n=1 Tax=Aquitalea denitrificans TaxID=519081 RepID=UPI00135A8A1C|nr:hypothetical protein [Aquitalea denitrificans]
MSSTDNKNAETSNIKQDGPTRDFIQFSSLGQLLDMMLEENDDSEWIEYIEKQISQIDALEDKILMAIRKGEICAEIWQQQEKTLPNPMFGFNHTLVVGFLQHPIRTQYGRAVLRDKQRVRELVYLHRSDFQQWLEKETGHIMNKSQSTITTPSWIKIARELGEKWMLEQEKLNKKKPGQIAIAKYVEGELSNRGVKGPRGRFLVADTIRKEALKGITGRKPNGK